MTNNEVVGYHQAFGKQNFDNINPEKSELIFQVVNAKVALGKARQEIALHFAELKPAKLKELEANNEADTAELEAEKAKFNKLAQEFGARKSDVQLPAIDVEQLRDAGLTFSQVELIMQYNNVVE